MRRFGKIAGVVTTLGVVGVAEPALASSPSAKPGLLLSAREATGPKATKWPDVAPATSRPEVPEPPQNPKVPKFAKSKSSSSLRPEHPDLGTIRYRDPLGRREVWLGFDIGGMVLPSSFGVFNRTVWTVATAPSWAVALTPWLAVGGRHVMTWLDTSDVRMRFHGHEVALSGRPLGAVLGRPSLRDRLAIGVETHSMYHLEVDGHKFRIGGVRDTILKMGYGIAHRFGERWSLSWQAQFRYGWVFKNRQRQVRGSAQIAFEPRPGHRLSAEGVAFYVNRDRNQAGEPFEIHGVYGQGAFGYEWMSRKGIGVSLKGRLLSSFLSGEAPVFEVRSESVDIEYGEAILGFRAVWR